MPPPRLLIDFKTIKSNTTYLLLYTSDAYIGSLVVFFINFMFSSDEGAYARNVRPRVFYSISAVYTNFIYFDLYQNMAG